MSLETTNQGLQKSLSALRKQNQQLKQELKVWRETTMLTQLSLVDYLKNLNSSETQWGVWVNPSNVDEYRVGQFCFENGGILDDWVCIGTLDKLSFGLQSQSEAIASWLKENEEFVYKNKKVRINASGLLKAWNLDILDSEFREFLEEKGEEIESEWTESEAEHFVYNKLPEILEQAKGEEY
jgi:hypothetical protein